MNVRMVSRLGNRALLASLWSSGPVDTTGLPFALISGEMMAVPEPPGPAAERNWGDLWAAAHHKGRVSPLALA